MIIIMGNNIIMDYITSGELNVGNNIIAEEISNGINISVGIKHLQFEKSNIYHKEFKQNIEDQNVRSSLTHKIYYHTNKIIFTSVEKLINLINEKYGTIFS